jgi:Protein of unknown function (DUF2586)
MSLSKVIVNFENRINRIENEDNISCLVFSETVIPIASSPTGRIGGQYTSVADIATAWNASSYKSLVIHHATDFFRLNPNGVLYIGCIGTDAQVFVDATIVLSQGAIRQYGFILKRTADVSLVGAIDTALIAHDASAVLVVGMSEHNYAAPAQDTLLSENVAIFAHAELGLDHPSVGVLLGVISRAKVSESVAWVDKFNLTGGGRLAKINGNPTRSQTEMLAANRYIVMRKYIGIDGVRIGNTDTTSGSTIEERRTIQKVSRIVKKMMTNRLNMPVAIDSATGLLAPSAAKSVEVAIESTLFQTKVDGELSDFEVIVDPVQKILETGNLMVVLKVVPYGTAKFITINMQLTSQV